MDENSLRELLHGTVLDEPPLDQLLVSSISAGRRLRRRRRIQAAIGSAAVVTVIAAVIPATYGTGQPERHPTPLAADAGMAYVLTGALTVLPVNLATRTALAPIKLLVPGGENDLAITSNGRTVYVAGARGYVTPISAATDRAGPPIWAGGVPSQILIPPRGWTAYVLDLDTGLVALDLLNGTQLSHIKIHGAMSAAMTPDGRMAYVAAYGNPPGVVPVNLITGSTLPRIALPNDTIIQQIVAAPNGSAVYLIGSTAGNEAATIFPVSTATNSLLRPISVRASGSSNPDLFGTGVVLAPDGRTAYVPSSVGVTPVDLTTGRVLPMIRLPAWRPGYELAVSPDGGTVYALQQFGTRLERIDTATGASLAPIDVGWPGFAADDIQISPSGAILVGRRYADTKRSFLNDDLLQLIQPATGRVTNFLITHGKAGNSGAGPIVFKP